MLSTATFTGVNFIFKYVWAEFRKATKRATVKVIIQSSHIVLRILP
jgi:hypothetical protein